MQVPIRQVFPSRATLSCIIVAVLLLFMDLLLVRFARLGCSFAAENVSRGFSTHRLHLSVATVIHFSVLLVQPVTLFVKAVV